MFLCCRMRHEEKLFRINFKIGVHKIFPVNSAGYSFCSELGELEVMIGHVEQRDTETGHSMM